MKNAYVTEIIKRLDNPESAFYLKKKKIESDFSVNKRTRDDIIWSPREDRSKQVHMKPNIYCLEMVLI
jgi:transposase